MARRSFARWLATSRLLLPLRRRFGKFVIKGLVSTGAAVLTFTDHAHAAYAAKTVELIRRIRKENNMLLSDSEGYQLFMAVKNTAKFKGDLAEVGVYKGGSARIIAEAKGPQRALHLFDTFEGLQDVKSDVDSKQFFDGLFATSFEAVKRSLAPYKNIHFYKGYFPGTAKPIQKKRFSFVHLDVDTYESTLSCLKFFYPRMVKGGIIISHDYISAKGVRKAFTEFFADKNEPVIEMLSSQACVVKL